MAKLKFNGKTASMSNNEHWKMLIVDDDEKVHTITKTVLKTFEFEQKAIKFYHAFNGKEAISKIKQHDIVIVLLDVVMETNYAGLDVVKYIREELNNRLIRIILRTGQPGSAPEQDVILNYDINDYKEKTELTSTKLFSSVITALRSYKELLAIQTHQYCLEHIVSSNQIIYKQQTFSDIVDCAVGELYKIININSKSQKHSIGMCQYSDKNIEYLHCIGEKLTVNRVTQLIERIPKSTSYYWVNDGEMVIDLEVNRDEALVMYIHSSVSLDDSMKNTVLIFLSNVTIALRNLFLNRQIIENLDQQKKELEVKVSQAVIEMTKKDQLIEQQSRLAQIGEIHQWRQPLNAIAANAISIETKLSLWEDDAFTHQSRDKLYDFINSKLTNIDRNVQSLSTTIDNFRDFYKPTKSKKIVNVNIPIEQAIKIVKASFNAKLIDIITHYDATVKLPIFSHELMQVILNILKNSQENFEDQNTVNPFIDIHTSNIRNGVRIKVCDNGGGISDDIKDNIFDPYFSKKVERNGTGLGLYMAKLIIEEHHDGKLSYCNTEEGVCFLMELNYESKS